MLDLKAVRDDPAAFDAAMARRGLPPASPEILTLDEQRRAAQTRFQALQERRKTASKEIGRIKGEGGDAEALMAEVAKLKHEVQALEDEERRANAELDALLAGLPNILAGDVPPGEDEAQNLEIRRWGETDTAPRPDHVEIGEGLGLLDLEAAAKLSGSRFGVLKGPLARLERALGQFMIDLHTDTHGYTEIATPLLVRDAAMFGTGQLPKFAEDAFKTTTDHWLIPTAEVPLTGLFADTILDREALPLRVTAWTPCFRSEAGSAGKDTRGILRQHQFWKVELVSVTLPEDSTGEHERMTDCAETVLKKLELPFRTVVLSAGDTGFAAQKTYDIEVWLPGQGRYREISSCSNTGDFQARRMKARTRSPDGKATEFVHTLNGSGVATGRALIAVMENYRQSDGSIAVPDVLRSYMGGIERIEAEA